MSDEVANPEPLDIEPTGAADAEVVTESVEAADNPIDETEPTETPEPEAPELIDYDFNGETIKVPKKIKENLMMHADYTKKTMELAEQRRAFEAQQAQTQQLNQEYVQDLAKLQAFDDRIAQFSQVNWSELIQQDAATAQRLRVELDQLRDGKEQLKQELGAKHQKRQIEQQQAFAKQYEEGQRVLAEKIPNWGPEVANNLVNHAATYGFSAQEAQQIGDPRAVQILHDAMLYRQLMAKQKTATKPTEPKKAEPNAKVKTNAPAKADPANMSMEAYAKKRQKEKWGIG